MTIWAEHYKQLYLVLIGKIEISLFSPVSHCQEQQQRHRDLRRHERHWHPLS